jgi:hypothetical protein
VRKGRKKTGWVVGLTAGVFLTIVALWAFSALKNYQLAEEARLSQPTVVKMNNK